MSRVEPWGVFVELGGVEGMISAAGLSWERFGHDEDVVVVREEPDVEVAAIDLPTRRVRLVPA
ncbi:S1 RNA-binding domain-containing protein [Streptomyces laurentii]